MEYAQQVRDESRYFGNWLRTGAFDWENQFGFTIHDEHLNFRAMSTEATVVPSAFYRGFFDTLHLLSPVYRAATLIETASGGPLSIPTLDDDESASIVAENADNTGGPDIEFGSFSLGAYKYSSKILRISNELLEDAVAGFYGQCGKTLSKRIARQANSDFTVGDGDNKPNGVVTQSQLGYTAASDSTITYADLVELQHSVDPAYWSRASFMMSAESFKTIRQVRDADGNLAYQNGRLLNCQLLLNTAMPAIAPESKPVVFGDLSNYIVRQSDSLQTRRYGERYAETYQVGLAAVVRLDGALAVPSAVKHLAMSN